MCVEPGSLAASLIFAVAPKEDALTQTSGAAAPDALVMA
jgi:hypothetical protein